MQLPQNGTAVTALRRHAGVGDAAFSGYKYDLHVVEMLEQRAPRLTGVITRADLPRGGGQAFHDPTTRIM